eukprot:13989582-Alexandrium_andersonii.AAC.1
MCIRDSNKAIPLHGPIVAAVHELQDRVEVGGAAVVLHGVRHLLIPGLLAVLLHEALVRTS